MFVRTQVCPTYIHVSYICMYINACMYVYAPPLLVHKCKPIHRCTHTYIHSYVNHIHHKFVLIGVCALLLLLWLLLKTKMIMAVVITMMSMIIIIMVMVQYLFILFFYFFIYLDCNETIIIFRVMLSPRSTLFQTITNLLHMIFVKELLCALINMLLFTYVPSSLPL